MDGRAEEEELEEQARAPPSTDNPGLGAPSATAVSHAHQHHNHHPLVGHNKGRKLINGIMKRGTVKGEKTTTAAATAPVGDELETYEYREAARAAVAGGNVYSRDNANSEDYALQKMPSQGAELMGSTFYQPAIRNDEIAKAEDARKPPALEAVAAALGRAPPSAAHNQQQQQQQQHPDGNNSKKGLFPAGRSARGMINSMRNLSIGNALRSKQKDVQDWEKQWDEDDDESDEGPEGLEQAPYYGASTAAAPVPVPLSPPRNAAAHEITTSLAQGVAAPPFAATGPTDLLSAAARVTPATSTTTTSTSTCIGAPPSVHQQQQLQQVSPDWETESLSTVQRQVSAGQRKPDVQMFLPMLRVLGKGSFGKVSSRRVPTVLL